MTVAVGNSSTIYEILLLLGRATQDACHKNDCKDKDQQGSHLAKFKDYFVHKNKIAVVFILQLNHKFSLL